MKILHTADLHIREKDLPEIEKCLQTVVRTAQEEKPDLAVIAGDVFDSRDVRVDSGSAIAAIGFVSALADVCPVVIVLGTPSHDGAAPRILGYVRGQFPVLVADRPMQAALWKEHFHSFPQDREFLNGTFPDVVVTLIPQPTKQYFQSQSDIKTADQEIGQAMSGLFMGFGATAAEYQCHHILIYHGGVSGAKLSNAQTLIGQEIEVSLEQLDLGGADLNLLGHIHLPQQLGTHTYYAGSIYMKDWGENHPHGFYLHNLNPNWTKAIETPARRSVRIQRDFTTEEGAAEALFHAITGDPSDVQGATVRVDVTVWQDQADEVDRDDLVSHFHGLGAESVDIRIIRVPRENVRAEAVLKADTLRDKLQRMAELRGEQVSEGILQKADELETATADEVIGRRAA